MVLALINHRVAIKILLALVFVVCLFTYAPALEFLVARWLTEPEYGHGFLLVGCGLYIFWQQRGALVGVCRGGYRYSSVLPLLVALTLYWVGTLAALQLALQLSFVAMLFSIAIAWLGVGGLRPLLFPLLLLGLSIPLPYFLEAQLTAKLQLVSSQLAVTLIEAVGMPVFLHGNVIDLGAIQLEVVEACSGLRYLYPLISLGVLVGYFYTAPWWRRVLIVLSTIPLTLVMNSARIAVTAWLVDRYGAGAAEGFFHDFEGLFFFLVCMCALMLEIALLEAVFAKRTLWQALDFEGVPSMPKSSRCEQFSIKPGALVGVLAALIVMGCWVAYENHRERHRPVSSIAYFPLQWGAWHGQIVDIADYKLRRLQVDSYLLANFYRPQDQVPVNVYVAFYGHQSAGVSPHSPKVCMPGGGWGITRFNVVEGPLHPVNEVVIEQQGEKQLVRYWFVERGEPMVNEYRRKWHLLKDAMLTGRTDGALVRITTPVLPTEQMADARARLQDLELRVAEPILDYLPAKVSRMR